jgi:hypothetical protein
MSKPTNYPWYVARAYQRAEQERARGIVPEEAQMEVVDWEATARDLAKQLAEARAERDNARQWIDAYEAAAVVTLAECERKKDAAQARAEAAHKANAEVAGLWADAREWSRAWKQAAKFWRMEAGEFEVGLANTEATVCRLTTERDMAQADNAALRALLEAHQVSNRRHIDDWRQRAKALSGYRDPESVTERAALLDCASELDAPLPAALAPRPDGKE